ncbi:MAG: hypothetical protein JSS09_03330 [Verrucomicrobia bacterium]|nr:hypothetical protein [Verrucomicrobiota bacterium]
MKSKLKKLAEESAQTRKMREKLQNKLEKLEEKITPEALKKKVSEIHKWIAKNGKDRIVLRCKTISLFDGNQNTAQISRKILSIMEQIQKDMQSSYDEKDPSELLKKILSLKQESNANL